MVQFAVCPVFMGAMGAEPQEINVCSLAFAILILYKGVEHVQSMSSGSQIQEMIGDLDCRSINTRIRQLTNTLALIARSDTTVVPKGYFWPTMIDRDGTVSTGTCNQTTVALSALLKTGFIDRRLTDHMLHPIDGITDDELKERYKLIVGALSWLINCQKGENNQAWSYGSDCRTEDGRSIEYAVLSSHFCYETLKKYHDFFETPTLGITSYVNLVDSTMVDRIRASCENYERWARNKIRSSRDGGVAKSNIYGDNEHSVLHT